MKIKPIVIALLLVLNLGLLTALILSVVEDKTALAGTAFAQGMSGSSKYLMVTGQYMQSRQALYILNRQSRTLAVFTFDQGKKRITYSGRASLLADFR